jgi:hypothetical protein
VPCCVKTTTLKQLPSCHLAEHSINKALQALNVWRKLDSYWTKCRRLNYWTTCHQKCHVWANPVKEYITLAIHLKSMAAHLLGKENLHDVATCSVSKIANWLLQRLKENLSLTKLNQLWIPQVTQSTAFCLWEKKAWLMAWLDELFDIFA